MRKEWRIPGAAVAAGVLCGFLRAFENRYAYEEDTGLLIIGHPLTGLVIVCCLLFAGATVYYVYLAEKKNPALFQAGRDVGGMPLAASASAVVLALCAAYDLYRFVNTNRLSLLVFCGFSAMTGVCVAANEKARRNQRLEGGSICAVVPVFWACYWLILTYSEHAADPVITDYMYALVGQAVFVLALYSLAGLSFGRGKARSAAALTLMAAFFSALNLTEPLAGLLLFGDTALVSDLLSLRLYFLFGLILMPAVAARLLSDGRQGEMPA